MMRGAAERNSAVSLDYYTLPASSWERERSATSFSKDESAATLGKAPTWTR